MSSLLNHSVIALKSSTSPAPLLSPPAFSALSLSRPLPPPLPSHPPRPALPRPPALRVPLQDWLSAQGPAACRPRLAGSARAALPLAGWSRSCGSGRAAGGERGRAAFVAGSAARGAGGERGARGHRGRRGAGPGGAARARRTAGPGPAAAMSGGVYGGGESGAALPSPAPRGGACSPGGRFPPPSARAGAAAAPPCPTREEAAAAAPGLVYVLRGPEVPPPGTARIAALGRIRNTEIRRKSPHFGSRVCFPRAPLHILRDHRWVLTSFL